MRLTVSQVIVGSSPISVAMTSLEVKIFPFPFPTGDSIPLLSPTYGRVVEKLDKRIKCLYSNFHCIYGGNENEKIRYFRKKRRNFKMDF